MWNNSSFNFISEVLLNKMWLSEKPQQAPRKCKPTNSLFSCCKFSCIGDMKVCCDKQCSWMQTLKWGKSWKVNLLEKSVTILGRQICFKLLCVLLLIFPVGSPLSPGGFSDFLANVWHLIHHHVPSLVANKHKDMTPWTPCILVRVLIYSFTN